MVMPVALIIISFSLMSAQYIFLIVYIIRKSVENNLTAYLGLQAPVDETALPISVHAMVAHVVLFITAVVQRISVRWAKIDAELLYGHEDVTEQREQQLTDADQSARELDGAVPIGAVVKGVGGTNEQDDSDASHERTFLPGQYDTYWAETQMWKSASKQDAQLEDSPQSVLHEETGTSPSSYSSKKGERDRVEQLRLEALLILNKIYERSTHILSLLSPFWKEWGFDITLVYLVLSGVSTQTMFSVVYVGLVLAFSCLRKARVQQHWHQISLFLTVLVLVQYLLTLGLPPTEDLEMEIEDEAGPWKVWAFFDDGNSSIERKVAISCAFVAAILAGVTLNAVTDEPRCPQFWFHKITNEDAHAQDPVTSDSSLRGVLEQHSHVGRDRSQDTEAEERPENSAVAPEHDVIGVQSLEPPTRGFKKSSDREERSESLQPTITSFISGLGQQKEWKDQRFSTTLAARKGSTIPSKDKNGEAHSSDASRTWRKDFNEGDASSGSNSLPETFSLMGDQTQLNLSEPSFKDIEKSLFPRMDPKDFTRRPISFENMTKLLWIRFSGPLVQLYVLAVATVDTNVISAVLLALAFSFLFQFTEVSAKKPRLMFLRIYLIVIIAASVIFQAPFEPSPHNSDRQSEEVVWSDIVGLYKWDTQEGRTFLYLLISLWILCQIQARIYQSPDFQYVETYGQEDAKVRVKRAVHEHNSRKYENMLERNKAERSHYARKARLTRLKALQKTERTVNAFYNVCVENEISILKKQMGSLRDGPHTFSSHRLVDDQGKEENLPRGLNKTLRRILRGKHWAHYVNQSLSSEAKAFVFRYSAWPVYGTMLLAAIANPSITTIVYPLIVFLYLIVEQPRPQKQAWTVLMVFVCFAIAFKYVLRSPQFRFCDRSVPFFSHGGLEDSNPSVRNFDHCAPAAGIGFDIFVLLALLGHRAVLYSPGVWDLGMSEEDMLLRSEIRGQELETPSEMMYDPGSVDAEGTGSGAFKDEALAVDYIWEAEQQCDDVEHVLSQAQWDIAGDTNDPQERLRTVKVPRPLPSAVHKGITPRIGGPLPTLALPLPLPAHPLPALDLFVANTSMETIGSDSDVLRRRRAARQRPKNDGWKGDNPQYAGRSVKSVPKSAPLLSRTRKDNDPRGSPSLQGSEVPRAHTGFTAKLMALRPGHHQAQDHAVISETMTLGQSRVQEALIQGRIIPEQPTAQRQNTLSLFNNEQKGFVSTLRQYFLRLTKENDYKAVGDYYLLIFMVDFISFVYVMFGFSAIFGEGSGRRGTWWTTNFIETRHLVTLLIMFTMIILDRVCYLTRSMVGKLILQYTCVFAYHIILFVVQDYVGVRAATRIFYILRCIYFLLSGLQIRDGFPMYTTAQFLMRNFSTLGIVLFEIYIFVPFLWLTRTLLDWAVLPTSLEIFQYFRFIDIYMWLYRNRAINRSRGGFRRKLGEKRRTFPRVYQGFGLFLLCVIALFLPFIIFSIFNPFFVGRKLREAKVSVDLVTFGNESHAGRSYEIYRRTSLVGEELDRNEAIQIARSINTTLDLREREKVSEAWFSFTSDSVWQPAEEDRQYLVEALSNYSRGVVKDSPQLSFLLSAMTQDLVTFGTQSMQIDVTKEVASAIANALSERTDFAEKIVSPLPRYLIVQSGSTVFDLSEDQDGRSEVCIRLIQREDLAFWTMGDCFKGKCECERSSPVTGESRRYLLQIADISVLQVGGATILTLYTAILFTIGSLLKRMFINMRFLVPYIDMPYTLHLYQLALDVMYARQDNQLEMEEILYNGLIDIYRDQHELVRWTGERALKLPAAWWDKSEVDNPFMVYPSFMETETEPYLDRTIE